MEGTVSPKRHFSETPGLKPEAFIFQAIVLPLSYIPVLSHRVSLYWIGMVQREAGLPEWNQSGGNPTSTITSPDWAELFVLLYHTWVERQKDTAVCVYYVQNNQWAIKEISSGISQIWQLPCPWLIILIQQVTCTISNTCRTLNVFQTLCQYII